MRLSISGKGYEDNTVLKAGCLLGFCFLLNPQIRRLEAQDAKRESEVGAGQRTSREYRYRVLSLTK